MDNKATRLSLPQDTKEKWMSLPASSPGNNTQEAQAQTQDPFQPLDYFHGGERTISPPPETLEKAMDPSLGCQLDFSQPGTPAASSSSCLSRSSTLNSFGTIQTQDSDTTLYSHTSSSSDDTVSVPRSSTFPALRSYPIDRKSFPNGANVHMVELPKSLYKQQKGFPFPIGGSVSTVQSTAGGEGTPTPNSQAPPSRHLTFPMDRPRNPTKLEGQQSSMAEGNEERTVPESPGLGNPLPKDSMISSTNMCYVFKQEMPPDEVEFGSLQAQTDSFVKSRLATRERWMIGLLVDSKQAGLHCQLGPNPSFLSQRRKNLHLNRPMSKSRREAERVISLASQNDQADRERPCSPDNLMFSAASTIANSEATLEPEDIRESEPRTRAEETQESCSPSPSITKTPCGEGNRESSSQDSDDDTSFPHEDCSPSNEEDEDFAYDQLVQGITNLVLESSCIGNVEERAVPVKLYVHNLLEQIMNHPKPANKSQSLCLPLRNLPMQNSEAPGDAGEPGLRGRSQGGNRGSSGGHKRKNKETPSHSRNHDDGDEDNPDDSSEEVQSNNPQEAKKRKTGRNSGKLSCPFRKRNPIRFNVRSHPSCALNRFTDFALLKRHIKTFHQKANGSSSCVRCKETFPDQAALKHHVMQPESCPLRPPSGNENPEDGITEEVEQALKERAKVNNVGSWESLWGLLFPRDPSERIPNPYHEAPVELDEVQNQCYDEEAVCEFVQQLTIDGQRGIRDHGFRYIVKALWDCRDVHSHERSKERDERDQQFLYTVHNELCKRQCASQPQQTHPLVVCNPPHGVAPNPWGPNFDDSLSPGGGMPLFNGHFPYNMMAEYGNDFGINATQFPAPDPNPSSEGAVQHAAPQDAPTAFPYKDMLAQNDRPCSAAGGSAGRSSGPSSQSHDSGYQTSQEQIAAALLQQQHADDARTGDHGWDCSFSTTLGGIPGQHAITPGQAPSDLCGVGTGPLMPEECGDAGSNSEEGFSPLG